MAKRFGVSGRTQQLNRKGNRRVESLEFYAAIWVDCCSKGPPSTAALA